ncbi:MAG: redox-regulated ATPase YchF [Candidatus Yanofskybacteria bacterium]|nr:redox-regulated ATPase YchF [Candidatus Yanofskybacteria bacterium]
MSLSVGIVGLPNVGKSTLFKALTKKHVDIANYPFCTIDPNVGIVKVPDNRLQKLADAFHSEKVIPTIIEFVDIAGLVRGASKGEGLGNKFLSHIREVDAIVHVVRCFADSEVIHVDESVDPVRDMETIHVELMVKDLETIEKRLGGLEKEARAQNKKAVADKAALESLQKEMDKGVSAFAYMEKHPEHKESIQELFLLSAKPVLYLLNADTSRDAVAAQQYAEEKGAPFVVLSAKEEQEAAGLTPEEAAELSIPSPRLPLLIEECYAMLGLITFFTTGPDETRAWTVQKGAKAPEAAGVIHSDFREKFIRAAVIQWKKLLEAGSTAEAMAKGWIRTEGKEYIVQDGDVMEFKHG